MPWFRLAVLLLCLPLLGAPSTDPCCCCGYGPEVAAAGQTGIWFVVEDMVAPAWMISVDGDEANPYRLFRHKEHGFEDVVFDIPQSPDSADHSDWFEKASRPGGDDDIRDDVWLVLDRQEVALNACDLVEGRTWVRVSCVVANARGLG